jgi:hypothetical protein
MPMIGSDQAYNGLGYSQVRVEKSRPFHNRAALIQLETERNHYLG